MSTPPPDPTVEGAGAEKTYIAGTRAEATVEADIYPVAMPPPDLLESPTIDVEAAGFVLEDYMVLEGQPSGRPELEIRMFVRCGLGDYTFTDIPPAPVTVDTGATVRWLPSSDAFSPEIWTPSHGAGINLVPGVAPFLDPDYSFSVRGGDEVSLPAVVFDGDAWLQLDNSGWSAQAFTFAIAAVMHQNPEGPTFGIFESQLDPPDPVDVDDAPTKPTDWGLRYRQGVVELFAGASVVTHPVSLPQNRVMMLAVSMDPTTGRLFVLDRNKSTRSFSTDGMSLFDIQLFFGRTGGLFDAGNTAYMDVLEIDYFDHALDFDELSGVASLMDEMYGIVG